MINKRVFSLFLCFMLLDSCSIIYPDIFMLSIKNNTNQDIKIATFFEHQKKEEFVILKQETHSEIIDEGRSFANNPTIFLDNYIDSIAVINSLNKGFIQYCNGKLLFLDNSVLCPSLKKNLTRIHIEGDSFEINKPYKGHKIRTEYLIDLRDEDFSLNF